MTEEEIQELLRLRLMGLDGGNQQFGTIGDLINQPMQNRLQLSGAGGIGGGMISGGFGGSYSLPVAKDVAAILGFGGGGAYGRAGGQKIREFSPEIGIQYLRRF